MHKKSGRKGESFTCLSCFKPGCEDGEMSMPVCVPSLQQQKGTGDCGVFAIAFAYHMAEFDQGIMQNHLSDCFKLPFQLKECGPREHRKMPETYGNMYDMIHAV